MSKIIAIGALGIGGLYLTGMRNPDGESYFNADGQEEFYEPEDEYLDPLLGFMTNLGIGLGTDLAVRAMWRGGKTVVAKATGKTAIKVATTVSTKVATEVATTAASKVVSNVAVKAATETATTAGTKVVSNVAVKAATETATTVATKAGTTTAVKAGTTAANASADAVKAAKAAKTATNAAKGAKASSMMTKLKGTPADLLMMILSQILIAVLDLDPENFAVCDNGEFDMNGFPDWAKVMISAVPFLGDVFDLVGNKLCFKGGCESGLDNENGLCYRPCNAGFKSDGATMCWKQYPAFEGNGMLHTIVNITKKMDTVVGDMLSECPAGSEQHGALCYPTCKAGYNGVLDRCWANIQKVNIVGRMPDKAGCPNGWRDDGTSCWDDLKTTGGGCRGGNTYECGRLRGAFGEDWGPKWCTAPIQCDPVVTTGSGTIKLNLFQRQSCGADEDMIDGLCYKKCGAGMEHVPGAPYDCRTIGDLSYSRGAGESMKCKAGEVQDGALCYKAREGFSLLAGTFSQHCPAGTRDIGVGCERESYNRGAGLIPLTIRMKPRK